MQSTASAGQWVSAEAETVTNHSEELPRANHRTKSFHPLRIGKISTILRLDGSFAANLREWDDEDDEGEIEVLHISIHDVDSVSSSDMSESSSRNVDAIAMVPAAMIVGRL